MNSETARTLLEKYLQKNNMPKLNRGALLHVCYDYDSEMIYSPNAGSFSREEYQYLLKAAQVSITKDFGGHSSKPVIEASPFSSLRVRSINSFAYAKDIIAKHYSEKNLDIPVIEANLKKMPTTVKYLPTVFSSLEYMGGYISSSFSPSISFVDEIDNDGKKRQNPIAALKQNTPFILINTASGDKQNRELSSADKEWVVLSGYRDYMNAFRYFSDEIGRNISLRLRIPFDLKHSHKP
jgi:hypothetical protein